jgi:hypothetical protein
MSHYTADLPFTAYNFRCYKRQSFIAYHRNPLHQLYPHFWLITSNTTQHLTIQSIVQHVYTEFITISPVYFIGSYGRPDTALLSFWYHCRPSKFNCTIFIASIVNFINTMTIDQVLSTQMLLLQHLLQCQLPLPT